MRADEDMALVSTGVDGKLVTPNIRLGLQGSGVATVGYACTLNQVPRQGCIPNGRIRKTMSGVYLY